MYKTAQTAKKDNLPRDHNLAVKFHEIEAHASNNLISQLAAVGDTLEQMAWRCGWLVNELYHELLANQYPTDYLEVCYYVSVVSLRSQRSQNTVKKWALTARFFQPHVARKYGCDVLPFSHFAYAASFDDQKDASGKLLWQSVLEYSWGHYINPINGVSRHVSVMELQERFEGKPRKTRVHVPQTMSSFIPSAVSAISPLNQQEDEPQDDLLVARQVILQFESALHGLLPRLSVSYPSVASGLAGVLSLLGKIKGAMSNREPTR